MFVDIGVCFLLFVGIKVHNLGLFKGRGIMAQKMFRVIVSLAVVSFFTLCGMNEQTTESQTVKKENKIKNVVEQCYGAVVCFVAISPNGKWGVAIVGYKGTTAIIWDIKTKEVLWTINSVGAATWNKDGTQIVLGFLDGDVECIEVKTGASIINFTLPMFLEQSKKHKKKSKCVCETISSIAFSEKNNCIAVGTESGNVFLYNTKTGQRDLIITHNDQVDVLAFKDKEEQYLISGGLDPSTQQTYALK